MRPRTTYALVFSLSSFLQWAMRDPALRDYIMTGMRRQEVTGLRGGNIRFNDHCLTLTGKVKGGDYGGREVRDALLRTALFYYLSSCDHLGVLKIVCIYVKPVTASHGLWRKRPARSLTRRRRWATEMPPQRESISKE